MAIWRRVACWISNATRAQAQIPAPIHPHTHKYVILTAFSRQQWFPERASTLHRLFVQNSTALVIIRIQWLISAEL